MYAQLLKAVSLLLWLYKQEAAETAQLMYYKCTKQEQIQDQAWITYLNWAIKKVVSSQVQNI